MIERISLLKNFGCFTHFLWNDEALKDFEKVNLLYGYNGSGKTTLSNLLYLTSRHLKNRDLLLKEYKEDGTEFILKTDDGNIESKKIDKVQLNTYVFNSKFIADHIYDGTQSNLDTFDSKANLTNAKIEKIDLRLKSLILRRNRLITWQNNLNDKLLEIWKAHQNQFNKEISGKRLTGKPTIIDESPNSLSIVQLELDSLYKEYTILQDSEKINEGLEVLKSGQEDLRYVDIEIDEVKENLSKEINTTARDSIKKHIFNLKRRVSDSGDDETNVENWLRLGKEFLKVSKKDESKCPLCETELVEKIDDIINDYEEFFSEELVKLLDSSEELEKRIYQERQKINENDVVKENLDKIISSYGLNALKNVLEDQKIIGNALGDLSARLREKRNSINSSLTIDDSIPEKLEKYNGSVKNVISEIDAMILSEKDRLEDLQARSITDEIKIKVKDCAILEFNSSDNIIIRGSKKQNSIISRKIDIILKEINLEISSLESDRDKEISKLDAETKYLSLYLEYLGITEFAIKKKQDSSINNITVSYKSGVKKDSLKHSLSEGEKTALAFAFFLSKIRVEQLEGGAREYENSIIVIDDPISSLDENRLFQTANLIESFFFHNTLATNKRPDQLFVLSHNITFLKFLSNILKANSSLGEINEYFISPYLSAIEKVPNGLKNFTNTYLQKLEEIVMFKEKDTKLEYDKAKKYLPNYIRIVLETFLAFKLALVKDDRGERLPGLNYLIGQAIGEIQSVDEIIKIGNIDKKGVERRLNSLKRIADTESHGSLSKLETVEYISDHELREYCKFTLQIMKFFDEIHFKRVKALTTVSQ